MSHMTSNRIHDKQISKHVPARGSLSNRRKIALATSVATAAIAPVAMGAKGIKVTNVAAGSAQVSSVGSKTIIRAADRTIINFSSFDVAAGASVQFIQPSSHAKVLDRINSQTPSLIDGSIIANGIVYFVNAAGVTFGPHSVVTANQIFTAGGSIANAAFLAGSNTFEASGKVVNNGTITTADGVALIGQTLVNNGTITAANGIVAFALGGDVYIGPKDDNIIVKVTPAQAAAVANAASSIQNTGTLTATKGEVDLESGDVYSSVFSIGGQVTAPKISIASGKQGTSAVTGTLDASNATGKGGRIEVTGNTVTLSGATLTASGSIGGGDVRVGGDFHGKGKLMASRQTLVDAASKISADATKTGSGGTVAVWSDGNTGVHGSISAKGATGAGGFIETSAKGVLDIADISVVASGATPGQWLLDPTNVDIVAAVDLNNTPVTLSGTTTFSPTAGTPSSTIAVGDITTALIGGANVTIVTHTSGTDTGTDAGNITLDSGAGIIAALTSEAKLTLTADGAITLNAPITATGAKLDLALNAAKGDITIANSTDGLNANTINTNGGSFTASATAGNVAIQSGTLTLPNSIATHGGDFYAGASGTITISAPVTTLGGKFTTQSTNLSISGMLAGGTIDTTPATGTGGAITIGVTGAGSTTDIADIEQPITTGGGAFKVTANMVTLGSTVSTAGGNVTIAPDAATPAANATVNINAAVTTLGGSFTVNAANVASTATGTIDTGTTSGIPAVHTGGGVVQITAATGGIALSGSVQSGTQNTTITSTTGSLSVNGVSATGATITLAAPLGTLTVNNIGTDLTTGSVNLSLTGGTGFVASLLGTILPSQIGALTLTGNGTAVPTVTGLTLPTFSSGGANLLVVSGVDAYAPGLSILTNSGGLSLSALNVTAPLTLQSAAGAVLSGVTVATTGSLTLNTKGAGSLGSIVVSGSVTASGPVTLNSSSDIQIDAPVTINPINLLVPTQNGILNLTAVSGATETAAGAITGTAASVGADTVVLAGTGNFNLNSLLNNVDQIRAGSIAAAVTDLTGTAGLTFVNLSTLAINKPLSVSSTTAGQGSVSVTAPTLNVAGTINSTGAVSLSANAMTITAQVTGGTAINISPQTAGDNILIGALPGVGLTLSPASLAELTGAGVVISTSGSFMIGGTANVDLTAMTEPITFQETSTGKIDLNLTGDSLLSALSQTYNGVVTLTSDTTLNASGTTSQITFNNTVDGAHALTVTAPGGVVFNNVVGSGALLTPLNSLSATASSGTIQINGGAIKTTGDQTYSSEVLLGQPAVSPGVAPTTLTAADVIFSGLVQGSAPAGAQSLTVSVTGTATFNGAVSALNSLTTAAGGTTIIGGVSITTASSQTYNNAVLLGSASSAASTTVLTAGSDGTNAIVFASKVDSNVDALTPKQTLEISATGLVTFDNMVGASPLSTLASLTIDAATGGSVVVAGEVIKTLGLQSYSVPVNLNAAGSPGGTAFTGSNITFNKALLPLTGSTPQALTIYTTQASAGVGGTVTFGDMVGNSANPFASVVTQSLSAALYPLSTTVISGGSVNTTGVQTYSDAVLLGAPATLTAGGSVTFGSTLDGGYSLAVNSAGQTFTGIVGTTPLGSLTTSTSVPGDTATIDAPSITTTGTQTYTDGVVLGANTLLTAPSGAVTFDLQVTDGSTVTGGATLTVNSLGQIFAGQVGTLIRPLGSLTTKSAGGAAAQINTGSIVTTNAQDFENPVTLGAATVSLTAGGDVTFGGTLQNSLPIVAPAALTISSADQIFKGVVGGGLTGALASLTTVSPTNGTAQIDSSGITTTGVQLYNDGVIVGANTTLAAGADVTFKQYINSNAGAFGLSVTSPDQIFDGPVGGTAGGVSQLKYLTTTSSTGTGTAQFTAALPSTIATVVTTAGQTYNDSVTLENDSTFTSTSSGGITFGGKVDSAVAPRALIVNTLGTTTFDQAVGSLSILTSLTTEAGGTTVLGNGASPITIATTSGQTYGGAVQLASAATLTGSSITFDGGITGAFALTTTGATTFDGTANIGSLQVNSAAAINAGITTTIGAQNYVGAVTIGNPANSTKLTATGTAQGITFGSTLDASAASQALEISAAGPVTFVGAVGNGDMLSSLTVDSTATGTIAINGAIVKTSGLQNYGNAVTLSQPTTLTASTGSVTFGSTIAAGVANISLLITSLGQFFDGGVGGGLFALSTLTTNGGTAAINGGSVITNSYQQYNNKVTLGGSKGAGTTALTTLTGSSFIFASSLDAEVGSDPQVLVINASSAAAGAPQITFTGPVGESASSAQLYSLTTNNTGALSSSAADVAINGGEVSTTAFQTYNQAVTLGANTVLNATNGVVKFVSTLDGNSSVAPATLTINSVGQEFDAAVGTINNALQSLKTTGAGVAKIDGSVVSTLGTQDYEDAVTVGSSAAPTPAANTKLVGSSITFGAKLDADQSSSTAQSLEVDTQSGGSVKFVGAVGSAGIHLYSLTTATVNTATANLSTTQINGGGVNTVEGQYYQDVVAIGSPLGSTTLTGTAVTFKSTLNALATSAVPQALEIDTDETSSGVLNETIAGGSVTLISGQILFSDKVGVGNALNSLTTKDLGTPIGTGGVLINGLAITTADFQKYYQPVAIGSTTNLTSTGGAITFVQTLDSASSTAQALTINTSGTTTFGGVVGGINKLQSLSMIGGGTTDINGGTSATITTTGLQSYSGPAVLGNTTTLVAGTTITFDGTVGGIFGLTSQGATTFYGAVNIGSLEVVGTTAVNEPTVATTAGGQEYTLAVTLGNPLIGTIPDTEFSASNTIGLANISFDTTLDAAPSVTRNVEVSATGLVTFTGAVGKLSLSSALASLTVDTTTNGSIAINGGAVKTLGSQSYGNKTTLGASPTNLTAGGDVTFVSTLDGSVALTIDSVNQIFKNAVGSTTNLISLTTIDEGGAAQLNGGPITTTGLQLFNDVVTLGADTTLTAGGNVTFIKTVDDVSTSAGTFGLGISSASQIFGGTVGKTYQLSSLTTSSNDGGLAAINGGVVKTAGIQTYVDAVTLGAATAMTAGGAVTFDTTLQDGGIAVGGASLTISSAGQIFGGAVGGSTASVAHPLLSLDTSGGTAKINGGLVATTGFQNYENPVTLGELNAPTAASNTVLSGSKVTFASTLNADQTSTIQQALEIDTQPNGLVTFTGAVGNDAVPLYSLITATSGSPPGVLSTTQINGGGVTTSSIQYYGDNVTLNTLSASVSGGPNTLLTGAAVIFKSTLDAQFPQSSAIAQSLEIDTNETSGTVVTPNVLGVSTGIQQGTIAFGGAVGTNLNSLVTKDLLSPLGTGQVVMNGGTITTVGLQQYNQQVFLGATTTLTSNTGDIYFGQTVDSTNSTTLQQLTVSSPTTITFNGPVGTVNDGAVSANYLESLTTTGGATTKINGGIAISDTIRTNDFQTYGGPVILGDDTSLVAGGLVTFDGTVSGIHALESDANTIFKGTVIIGSLIVDGTTAINGGVVNTSTGDQDYGMAVTLGNPAPGSNTVLTATDAPSTANINFFSTLDADTTVSTVQPLVINATGTTTFGGAVGMASPNTSPSSKLQSLTVDNSGTTPVGLIVIQGGAVNTTDFQIYGKPVTMNINTTVLPATGATETLTAGGNVQFVDTLDGAVTLSITSLNQIFGNGVGTSTKLASLTTTSNASGMAEINGGAVLTTGFQKYNDAVSLGNSAVLTAGGDVTFVTTVDDVSTSAGAFSLEVDSLDQIFGGQVGGTYSLASVLTSSNALGTAAVNGGVVTTTGAQHFEDAATLGANTTMTAGGDVTFDQTLQDGGVATGGATLLITSKDQIFTGAVGGSDSNGVAHPLQSLTTFSNASGFAKINGGAVTTLLTQDYEDAVTLASTTPPSSKPNTMLIGTNITFARNLDADQSPGTVSQALEIDTQPNSTVTFKGAVGSDPIPLYSLATATLNPTSSNLSTTEIGGGSVTTTSFQMYQNLVTLNSLSVNSTGGPNTVLKGSAIDFAATLNAKLGSVNQSLEVDTTQSNTTLLTQVIDGVSNTIKPGQIIFGGAVGGVGVPLYSLTTNDNGSTHSGQVLIEGQTITTLNLQKYNQAVLLASDALLTSTQAGDIYFGMTVDSIDGSASRNLTVDTGGVTTFNEDVGSSHTIGNLITDATGSTVINGGSTGMLLYTITTTGLQTYGDKVLLGAETYLNAGGDVTFATTLNDAAAGQRFGLTILSQDQIFNGAVGNVNALNTLATTSTDGKFADINGSLVETTLTQLYNDDVRLGYNPLPAQNTVTTSMTGSAITFMKSLSADSSVAAAQALDVRTAVDSTDGGTIIFNGAVGSTSLLGNDLYSLTTNDNSLKNPGLTQINGGAVNTTTFQLYDGNVTLSATSASTLPNTKLTAGNTVTFGSLLDSAATATVPQGLEIDTQAKGTVAFNGAVGSKNPLYSLTTTTLNATPGLLSTTQINGGSVTTANFGAYTDSFQIYNDIVTLGQAASATVPATTTLTGAAIEFASTLDAQAATGGQALVINTTEVDSTVVGGVKSGQIIFDGAVGGATGTVQNPLFSLTTIDSGTAPGTGVVLMNGQTIKTTDLQKYDQPVLLGATTTLTSTQAGLIDFVMTVDSNATAQALTVNTSGTTVFGGVVGWQSPLVSLTTDAGGVTQINGGLTQVITSTVTTQTFQTYNDGVTLGRTAVLTAGGDVTFASTLQDGSAAFVATGGAANTTGASGLTVNSLDQIFQGVVGGNNLPLYNLTTISNGAGTVQLQIGVPTQGLGSIVTVDSQTYQDPMQLLLDATLTSTTSGAVTFDKTVDSLGVAHSLTVSTAGLTEFKASVGSTLALANLTTNAGGVTQIGDNTTGLPVTVSTNGFQLYSDAVTLGASTSMNANGNVTFAMTLQDGSTLGTPSGLTIDSLNQIFQGVVGGNGLALANLTTTSTGAGFVEIQAGVPGAGLGTITTVGSQQYNDAMQLFTDATLASTAGGNITLAQTVDSDTAPHAFTVNTGGTTTFSGALGSTVQLLSVTTDDAAAAPGDLGGITQINGGSVTTLTTQTYNDPVTLGTDTKIVAGGDVTFAQTLQDGSLPSAVLSNLSITSLDQIFQGVVGGGPAAMLNSLTTTSVGAGFAEIQAGVPGAGLGTVTTVAFQTYHDAVKLFTDATTTSTGSGNITFGQTVDSDAAAHMLTVNTAGDTYFLGAVGMTVPLQSLTTDDMAAAPNERGGTTHIDGGLVNTILSQTYLDAVALGKTVSSPSVATLSAGGDVTFATILNDDASVAPGSVGLNIVSFNQVFSGTVGVQSPLSTLTTTSFAQGSAQINGITVTTSQGQTYNDPVTLGQTTQLNALGDVKFASTLDDGSATDLQSTPSGLSIDSVNQIFQGPVGANAPLASLNTTSTGAGFVEIQAGVSSGGIGSITTVGSQIYNDSMQLFTNSTLTSVAQGPITFAQLVDSAAAAVPAPQSLTINSGGTTTFAQAVGSKAALLSLTVNDPASNITGGLTQINGGVADDGLANAGIVIPAVTTTAGQTYNNDVTIGQDTTLTGSTITFVKSLIGQFDLAVEADATFGGLVSLGSSHGVDSLFVLRTTTLGTPLTPETGVAINTTNDQDYTGAMTLQTASTLTSGTNIQFHSTVDGGFDLTANANTTNGVDNFDAAVGGVTPLNSVTALAQEINLAPVTTTGGQKYTAIDVLTANAVLTGGSVTVSAATITLDAAVNTTGAQNYVSRGKMTSKAILNAGDSITASAEYYVLNGAVSQTNQLYVATTVGTDAADPSYTMQGIYQANAGGVQLDAPSQGNITLTGNTIFDAGNSLTLYVRNIVGTPSTNLEMYAGTVGPTTKTLSGGVAFLPADVAPGTAASPADPEGVTASPGTIEIYASQITADNIGIGWFDPKPVLGAHGSAIVHTPNTASGLDAPAISSVVFRNHDDKKTGSEPTTGQLRIAATSDFTMDPDVKMAVVDYPTSVGVRGGLNLSVQSGGLVTLSSVSVQGYFDVSTDKVQFTAEGDDGKVAVPNSTDKVQDDPTVAIVATGEIKVTPLERGHAIDWKGSDGKAPNTGGKTQIVQFAWDFGTGSSFQSNLPGLSLTYTKNDVVQDVVHEFTSTYFKDQYWGINNPVALSPDAYLDSNISTTFYDSGTGVSVTPSFKAEGIASETPNTAQTTAGVLPSLVVAAGLTGSQIKELALMHITAREIYTEELIDGLDGRRLYQQDPGDSQAQIAADQLDNNVTQQVLNSFHAVQAHASTGSATRTQTWQAAMSSAFQVAWHNWTGKKPEEFDPVIFRRAMLADPVASQYLLQLQSLFVQLQDMGLTDREFNISRKALVTGLMPKGLPNKTTWDLFYDAIVPKPGTDFVSQNDSPPASAKPSATPGANPSATPPDNKPVVPAPVRIPAGQSASIKGNGPVAMANP